MDRISAVEASRTELPNLSGQLNSLQSVVESAEPSVGRLSTAQADSSRIIEQLSELALKLAHELDLHRLLSVLVVEAAKIVGAERSIAWSVVDGCLRRDAWYPESDTHWPPVENVPEECFRAVRHLESIVTRPVVTRPASSQLQRQRNAIYVPLVGTQNRILAVLELSNKRRGGFFNPADLGLANCVARIATSAVDRARLFSRIEEWSKSIEMLLSFNATVNQHLQPQEMVRQLVVNASGFIDADGGAAGIVVNSESEPAMECDGYYFDDQWHPFIRRWTAGQGVPGTVLQTEFPLLIEHYPTHALVDQELASKFEIGSCICVAIKNASERVLGFFKLHRRFGKPAFTWQEAALLESLGNTVAVAIENVRLVKSLEQKNEQVKNLSAAHVRRLEVERQHIARELHDETGQVLIGLKLRLQLLSGNLMPQQTAARRELDILREQIGEATVRLKDLAKRLRPPTLDELGFEATLQQLVAEYRQQVPFAFHLQLQESTSLSSEAQTALYRIVQESLTNVVKHSGAANVSIHFGQTQGRPSLTFKDDGCGFNMNHTTSGLGLIGIRERVKMLGATIEIVSSPGKGTLIHVKNIPNENQEASNPGG